MNPDEIDLLPIKSPELKALRTFAIDIFLSSYAHLNTAENMQDYLDRAFSESQLTTELNNPDSHFYFAKHKNQILGYLKVNFGPAQTDLKDSKSLEVERIYMAQAHQGKKIGQQLMKKARQIAVEHDLEYLWLGVWRKNPKAIAFYEKNGFKKFGTHVFVFGDEEQVDCLMRFDLD